MIREKLKTLVWFVRRPSFWPHAAALAFRKFGPSDRSRGAGGEAEVWAAKRVIPYEDVLRWLGLLETDQAAPQFPEHLVADAKARAAATEVAMGGPGHLDLLYSVVLLSGAAQVVETGVAYGWSSLAILVALDRHGEGRLASVDMPYPKLGNERFVGIVVPEAYRSRWKLIRQPDRNGLKQAINYFDGSIDVAHYDSDKSYAGRMYAFPLIWRALRPGGLLISDDIQDNFGFRDYCEQRGLEFRVTSFQGKFVGIAKKTAP